jgi:hypothetical protein
MATANEPRKAPVNPTPRLDSKPTGAILSVVTFTLDASDRGAQTAFGLVQDVRGEIRTAVDGSIDALENVVRGFFRIGKRATARIDELASELTAAGERTLSGVIRGLKETTRAAGELASTAAAAALAGEKVAERPSAQA